MRRRYWALWVFSFVLEWAGICVWVFGGFFTLYILTVGYGYSANPADAWSMLVYQLMVFGIWRILIVSAIGGLVLLSAGQFISLLMDIEENTRAGRLVIKERIAQAAQTRDMWQEP